MCVFLRTHILTHPLIEYSLLQPRSAPEGAPLRPTPGAALHKDTTPNHNLTPKGRNPPRIPLYTPMLSFCFHRCGIWGGGVLLCKAIITTTQPHTHSHKVKYYNHTTESFRITANTIHIKKRMFGPIGLAVRYRERQFLSFPPPIHPST